MAVTVSRKTLLALATPSFAVIVMVVVPDWLGEGMMVTVRFAPQPPKKMFVAATSAGLEEVPTRIKSSRDTRALATVRLSGPQREFSATVCNLEYKAKPLNP